ncbi:sterile alpha motif domain-containing protein 9-like [Notolabrus celidotus]|uniref:sterile alpha motif domain-containing protein 9-like n=1 Tax=Notolabrus celidotus TaxID=1203425 RepID=UPI00148FFA3E|nr:sterile alpha motif domain-containing protein 9-like [Notolabrus celidotus]
MNLEEGLPPDINNQDKRQMKEKLEVMDNLPGSPCRPYQFGYYHDTHRYIENYILNVTESGPLDLIEPCHEFKAFVNVTDETRMGKFSYEVIRFASACMNSRTNGTIHFGIGDNPDFIHGQVLGVVVKDKEAFIHKLKKAIDYCFELRYKQDAQSCIRTPRFVEVLNKNQTSSYKCVIEVDIVPESLICEENFYCVVNLDELIDKKKGKERVPKTKSRKLFVRDGGSSRNLLSKVTSDTPMVVYDKFNAGRSKLFDRRKQAELKVIKSSTQGSRLSYMITGGSLSLDKSQVLYFKKYLIVANKSHPMQLKSLGFLTELNPTAVLDFDPESATNGLQRHLAKQSTVFVNLPVRYKVKKKGVQDIAEDLKLTQGTSWVFCNGGIEDESPSDIDQWFEEKGASVLDVVSFLCRTDVLPNKRFLVVFLILSTVSDQMDPLVETFVKFYNELKGKEQILCLCENEKAFTSWRDLIEARCKIDISDRCIYELSFPEINGTVLSLFSENRRSRRFLPCGGGSSVLLGSEVEHSLNTLEVLCVNQCEGGNEDKLQTEENFYNGGKVSWSNLYFLEKYGSKSFIKRERFDYIIKTVIPELCSQTKACELFHLMHVPGCGGTTLAMHTLWDLRHSFRCAVLKNCSADFVKVAEQVVKLLMYDHKDQLPRVPVLLMLDDFDDKEKVFELQQLIEKECANKDIRSKTAQVILLNCMRSESPVPTAQSGNTVFLGNNLSDNEQRLFEAKLIEVEKKRKNVETFYDFMFLKKNLKSEYVEGVARNTLKNFDVNQKHAQLLAVLALLGVSRKGSSLPISLCEEFLDLKPKPVCGSVEVEEGFEKFSPLIARCSVHYLKIIHPRLARYCLQELTKTHNVSMAEIPNFLPTTNALYESTEGVDKLLKDVRQILMKRCHSLEEESQSFS